MKKKVNENERETQANDTFKTRNERDENNYYYELDVKQGCNRYSKETQAKWNERVKPHLVRG